MFKLFRWNGILMVFSFLVLLMTPLLTGCGKEIATTPENDKPKFVNGKLTKEFHIKAPTLQSFNEMIIADQKGFFKE